VLLRFLAGDGVTVSFPAPHWFKGAGCSKLNVRQLSVEPFPNQNSFSAGESFSISGIHFSLKSVVVEPLD